jgi:hypothetical protein
MFVLIIGILTRLFLKIIIQPLFIDQIIDDCAGIEILSLMDGFSSYNKINILLADQHKTTFIFPLGTFAYRKLPFSLNNVGANFQRAMSYAFHDINHIVNLT